MTQIRTFKDALTAFGKAVPDYENKTWLGANNLLTKALKERVGKDEWKRRFMEHIISHYV